MAGIRGMDKRLTRSASNLEVNVLHPFFVRNMFFSTFTPLFHKPLTTRGRHACRSKAEGRRAVHRAPARERCQISAPGSEVRHAGCWMTATAKGSRFQLEAEAMRASGAAADRRSRGLKPNCPSAPTSSPAPAADADPTINCYCRLGRVPSSCWSFSVSLADCFQFSEPA